MPLESPIVVAYCVFVTALLGLCMGSFLNCLAWRMTHGESVLHGRSHCTSCGHVLSGRDLIPVLSWAMTRGRCRYCGAKVSARYPATELLCAVVYVSIFLRYGLTLETVELLAFASVLLVLSLTDLDEYIIPNETIVVSIAIRLAYLAALWAQGAADPMGLFVSTLVGGFAVAIPVLAIALLMDRVLGRESFGGGDVKLLFVAGLYFGWQQCLFLIIVACVVGIVAGSMGLRGQSAVIDGEAECPTGGPSGGEAGDPSTSEAGDSTGGSTDEGANQHLIPFGPAITFACWITMLIGPQVLDWYLGLMHF